MRIIRTEVFSFSELNEEAQENAFENVRNSYYEHNDFAQWVIDDCSLLEPSDKELRELFGKDYNFPLIKNNRDVYFSLGRNRYVDVSKAMEVTNDHQFLKWLGIDENNFEGLYYHIQEDTILIDVEEGELTDEQNEVLDNATEKFEEHCQEILNRIEADLDYRFTDEAIKDDIEVNEYEFLENGKML